MIEALVEATGENTKSKAIDRAVNHYCICAGENAAHPVGTYEELMQVAVKKGSVTPAEIAEILDSDELQIKFDRSWSIERN